MLNPNVKRKDRTPTDIGKILEQPLSVDSRPINPTMQAALQAALERKGQ